MIGIINYGLGNLKSLSNALDNISESSIIVNSRKDFAQCSHLILPGVGAFNFGIEQLRKSSFIDEIERHVSSGKLLLGICLGMQLLFEKSSENGEATGLGFIKGEVKDLNEVVREHSVPHVGWNNCDAVKESIFEFENSFYFTHSFYCQCANSTDVLTNTNYGISFHSSIMRENIIGFQFHPEKSHRAGLNLLKKFASMKC